MVQLMRAVRDPKQATTPCEAAQVAAFASCADRIGEGRLEGGNHYCLARDLVEDLPLCERVGEDAFQTFHNFGK
jgi:hypothetical protein